MLTAASMFFTATATAAALSSEPASKATFAFLMFLRRAETEYKMLNLFRKNPRQVLTRGQLLEKLWDIDERFVDEHTLTTSISRIRSKIESDGGVPYIKTVYGMGYQWTGGEAK